VDYKLDHECNETIILLLTILLVVKEVICSSTHFPFIYSVHMRSISY
jgi:hypothetical protein